VALNSTRRVQSDNKKIPNKTEE